MLEARLMKNIGGWGRYRSIDARVLEPRSAQELAQAIRQGSGLIARGLGRSYGDSSLAPTLLSTCGLDHFLGFEPSTGLLTCESGVSLDEILRLFVPRGWFLPVTPGTRFVTVGGAIAGDVHGKNHHRAGSFSRHVTSLGLLLASGECLTLSPTSHRELFEATCGGMGLTGIITRATFALKPITSSSILETRLKLPHLEAVLDAFAAAKDATYSVAWIDCMARGAQLGRSVLILGEHCTSGELLTHEARQIPIPFDLPRFCLNSTTATLFNSLYYALASRRPKIRRVGYAPFFYPLDALSNWNRLYGASGFVQYQCVLPQEAGARGLKTILERVSALGQGSFLAVLKLLGPGIASPLSFPMAGYTLALDFRPTPAVLACLNELDRLVVDHGGRIALTKDARMSQSTFRACYPRWEAFEAIRQHYGASGTFSSRQSERLGLS
jgi:decaprenylphospho-beta-D-ribofuranose 2-oxidase